MAELAGDPGLALGEGSRPATADGQLWSYRLTAGAVLVWAVLVEPDPWAWPAFGLLAWAWGGGVAVDLVRHELPDRFTLAAAAGFALALLPAVVVHQQWGRWRWMLLASAITTVALFVIAFINPAGFGLGDVKLALTTGAALGWVGGPGRDALGLALLGTMAAFICVAAIGVVLLATGRARKGADLAFGPCLVSGVLLAPLVQGWMS